MNSAPLDQIIKQVFREMASRKALMVAIFSISSLLILGLGFIWPSKYQSSTTIFVDEQNIIKPLVESITATSKLKDRAKIARELLQGRQILDKVALQEGFITNDTNPLKVDEVIKNLRQNILVKNVGSNLIQIVYTDNDPTVSFRVAKGFANVFIAETISTKKKDSREAYTFIDTQVKNYHDQLKESELRLKQFLANNVDGSQADSSRRMTDVRAELQKTELELKQSYTIKQSLEDQLSREKRVISRESPEEKLYKKQIEEFEKQLDTLRLSYLDTHPDIVSLKIKVDETKSALIRQQSQNQRRKEAAEARGEVLELDSRSKNRLYEQLRSDLAKVKTKIVSLGVKRDSLTRLLSQETSRMQRVHDHEATLSELRRDTDINRDIYNELIKRREHARVSMHLDMAGQGLALKVQEPARIPLSPSGLKLIHFMIGGLLVGILLPFAFIISYVLLDPRVRSANALYEHIDLPVMASIPQMRTPLARRLSRVGTVRAVFCVVISLLVYFSICWLKFIGAI